MMETAGFGIGVDILSIQRMKEILIRSGEIFLRKVFSESEIQRGIRTGRKEEYFSSSFAAKEAVFKAFGRDDEICKVDFKEIEVSRGEKGEPVIKLHGSALALAEARSIGRLLLSVSYEEEYAVAMVLVVPSR